MTMEANLNVPKGFRFLPTKKELFYFLWQKISGQQPSCGEYAIGELDVYNEEQLEEVFLKGEREDCPVYMFTRLKFKGKIRIKNKDRKVGKGTWKTQQHGKLEGFGGWRDFRYVNSGCKRRHHQWNMTEFFLDEKQYPDVQDYVISCVKRKYTKARDQEENECIDQFTEQEECECKDQIMEQEKEEESSADDSFAEYLNGVLMSPTQESETVAIPIPQPHHETMQRAINNTDPYIVPALVEEPLQIANCNTDTNIVSASIEEAKRTPSTPAGDQSNNLFAEAEKVLQSDDQSNNLFAEAEKVLQSDDLSSMSWIDEMFDNDNVHEFEPLLLLDEENGFSTCYNY